MEPLNGTPTRMVCRPLLATCLVVIGTSVMLLSMCRNATISTSLSIITNASPTSVTQFSVPKGHHRLPTKPLPQSFQKEASHLPTLMTSHPTTSQPPWSSQSTAISGGISALLGLTIGWLAWRPRPHVIREVANAAVGMAFVTVVGAAPAMAVDASPMLQRDAPALHHVLSVTAPSQSHLDSHQAPPLETVRVADRNGGDTSHLEAKALVTMVSENTEIPAQALVKPIFTTFNTFFLPPFALMIFLPNWAVTKSIMKSPFVPTTAALLFLAELVAATQADYTIAETGVFDSERWQAAASYLLLEAVADPAMMRDFASATPSYIAQDWLHVCAWDLIGARWVYLDGLEKGIWTSHSVFLCQAAGPVGWLAHSLTVALTEAVRKILPSKAKEGSNAD